jgi:hypothetical protein
MGAKAVFRELYPLLFSADLSTSQARALAQNAACARLQALAMAVRGAGGDHGRRFTTGGQSGINASGRARRKGKRASEKGANSEG